MHIWYIPSTCGNFQISFGAIYIISQWGWQESFYLKRADKSACVFSTWLVPKGFSRILFRTTYIYSICQHWWQESFYLKKQITLHEYLVRYIWEFPKFFWNRKKNIYVYIYISKCKIRQYGWQESFYLKRADNSACELSAWLVPMETTRNPVGIHTNRNIHK